MSINKDVSNKQEHDVAEMLGGRVVPGSGCGDFNAGDVEVSDFLIECKTVTKRQTSFSVKAEWLDKVNEQAFEAGKSYSALAFRFDPEGGDYIVVDSEVFAILLGAYKQQYNLDD